MVLTGRPKGVEGNVTDYSRKVGISTATGRAAFVNLRRGPQTAFEYTRTLPERPFRHNERFLRRKERKENRSSRILRVDC